MCLSLVIPGMTLETIRWKLFPFSLEGNARQRITHSINSIDGNWDKLREKFCLAFFPASRVATLLRDILGFQQKERETLCRLWSSLVNSRACAP